MTAIAALVEDGIVYMGGDSAGVAGLSLTIRRDEKIFTNGPFLFGFTTSFRMGSLLRYSFTPPDHPKRMGLERYMNTEFVNAVRECFNEGGYSTIQSNVENGGTFLVGYRKKLFVIESDFQVAVPHSNYDAIGCGHDLCKGSLYSTDKLNLEPRKRIRLALQAAERFSGGVRSPFTIKQL